MSYDMNLESKRQELGRRLVGREIYLCLSSLVSDLASFEKGEYYDEVMDAFYVEDFQEALEQYIAIADIDELEYLIEENGYWSDFVDELRNDGKLADIHAHEDTEEDTVVWYLGDSLTDASSSGHTYDNEDDALRGALEAAIENVREKVVEHVQALDDDERRELCDELRIDADEYRAEVYEHWAVSNWLGGKLAARGQKTIGLYGMTVWCRCTTGQAICLDRVIQEIACELWDDELGSKDDGRKDTV